MDSLTALDLRPPRAVLTVAGEFDASASIDLRGELERAVAAGCISFAVDASGVTFVDATALGTLVRLHNAVTPLGGEVVVSAASANFRWSATVAGMGDAFGLALLPELDDERPTPSTSG
jgi:anti-sigma B factor antagonist